MTEDELVENLGTIAHSGSKEFMEALKADGDKNDALIGIWRRLLQRFHGCGQRASLHPFMACRRNGTMLGKQRRRFLLDPVRRRTTAGNQDRHKAEGRFCGIRKEDRIKDIIKKYSAFVQFPVSVNGEKSIRSMHLDALKNEIKDEEYDEFYKFQSNDFEPP